ncbi:hypothetical protein AB0B45_23430 [Nonomuraea sp. NPDC049152]|uniref:hypothetical protein n=1 Tax=Nonomuraea sp. NPDC049152 TaxID=3154350 RepID=UPI00340DFCB5
MADPVARARLGEERDGAVGRTRVVDRVGAGALGYVSPAREGEVVSMWVDRLGIRLASSRRLAGQLSGGNQQKVSLAKCLAAETENVGLALSPATTPDVEPTVVIPAV